MRLSLNWEAGEVAEKLYDDYLAALQKRNQSDPSVLIAAASSELETLKSWLDSFRPFPPAVVAELKQLYTVRLTYHSNAIEGNTLTQSETEMVLSHGITVGGKTLVEHLEVIGHRDAMQYMEELAAASTCIGEWEIKNLHCLILLPVDQAQGTREAGRYRNLDVRAAGTEHVYPPHYQVAALMSEFAAWLASDAVKGLAPIDLAAQVHYRLVTIHPFRDGNGRAARLLMNLFLLRAGYPIAVITNARLAEYLEALVYAQSQGDNTNGDDINGDDISRLVTLINDACRESLIQTLALLSTAGESRGRGQTFYETVLPILLG